jgi:hypothetical protein
LANIELLQGTLGMLTPEAPPHLSLARSCPVAALVQNCARHRPASIANLPTIAGNIS